EIMDDIARVHIYNVVTPTGIAQAGAAAALTATDDGVEAAVAAWQHRRDVLTEQLAGWPTIPAAGGWSQLLDVGALGYTAEEASRRLLAHGRVAATPMTAWGEVYGDRFVRLVFSNEPPDRLATLRARVEQSLRA
ncbi:MAG: aminotransferase class I/II-fold pyridoxal phosphate-dependent enzyme, partial [Rhodothermales bacterium]|nr:aminotransferase class I/II-fold pyridoxal phosphate-dependent enzyme [Rhodothermales bacterium]